LLAPLGLTELWLVLLGIGIVTSAFWLWRERRRAGLLLLLWLGLPLGGFWFRDGAAILRMDVRYFAFLFPVAVLLVALAVDWAAVGLGQLLHRLGEHRPGLRLAYALVLTLVVANTALP